MSLMFLKSIDMFLKCSWIFIAKIAGHSEKITKIWISQQQKELLRLNKKKNFIIFEWLSFREKKKKLVDTSFNNLFEMLISMIRHKWQTKSNQKKKKSYGTNG